MKRTVTIDTREVGQAFGCEGLIRSRKTGRVLGRTRTYPIGDDSSAFAAALRMAEDLGYDVWVTDEQIRVDD